MRCCCGYQFVFLPDLDNSGLTDNKFLSLVRKASADGRYYFTFPQLYSVWCGVGDKANLYDIFCVYVVAGIVLLGILSEIFPEKGFLLFLFLFSTVAFIHGIMHCNRNFLNQKNFRRLVKKWQRQKGTLDKMLVKPSLHEPPPKFPESDLYDYGVERIIIVERPLLVDLLVRNGFHADQRALIFSMDDYPFYISKRAKTLLKESPSLPVYLLHDATEEGMNMQKKINLPGHTVIDLGVFPEHMENLPVLKPLRLKHQDYQAPLDALPYAALSALGTAAIAAGIPFDEVIAGWQEEGNSVGDSAISSYG